MKMKSEFEQKSIFKLNFKSKLNNVITLFHRFPNLSDLHLSESLKLSDNGKLSGSSATQVVCAFKPHLKAHFSRLI
jgi:hypothetical protein